MKWIEYAYKYLGLHMMPWRQRRSKYEPMAERLKKVAFALHRVEKARKIIEEAQKNNKNGLIF